MGYTAQDLMEARSCFGVHQTHERWGQCQKWDLNGDGIIDIDDIQPIAMELPEKEVEKVKTILEWEKAGLPNVGAIIAIVLMLLLLVIFLWKK
jgi:hypothetical protein